MNSSISINNSVNKLPIIKNPSVKINKNTKLKWKKVNGKPYVSKLKRLTNAISKVLSFIQKHHFQLYDIKRYFWKRNDYEDTGTQRGQLVMGDALYLKNPEQIMKIPNINTNKIIRSICIYLCYGYIDLAQTLLKYSYEQKLINNQINEKIKSLISKCKRSNLTPLPYFKGKGRIGNIFKKISDMFNDGPYAGYVGEWTDENLGN